MKRFVLISAMLFSLLLLSVVYANPLVPGYINELFFTGGSWVLELQTYPYMGGNLNGWSIASRAGTAAIKPGISWETGCVLVTPDSLLVPLTIDPTGDSVVVRDSGGYAMSLTFGSDPQSDVQAPAPGWSICFDQCFYLDQTPTVGASNDTSGGLATVRGAVLDSVTRMPVPGVYMWDWTSEYRCWITKEDSGKFTARLYAHNCALAISAPGYQGVSPHFYLIPGQVIDTLILLKSLTSATEQRMPSVSALYQNFPNPFNPSTTIIFDLPSAGKVTLQVYDALGREVAELVRGLRPAGQYKIVWNGKDDNGVPVGSGVYLARLQLSGAAGEQPVEKVIKLLLVH